MALEEKQKQEDALLEKIKEQGDTQIDEKLVEIKNGFSELISQAKTGMITDETFKEGLKPIEEKLKEFDPKVFANYQKEMDKYKEMVETQGTEIAKLKEGGGLTLGNKPSPVWKGINDAVDSEKFRNFADDPSRKISFDLKTVSLTGDYTGNVFISAQDSTVVDHPEVVRLNIRDLMRVSSIDFPILTFLTFTNWDRAVDVVAENGVLPESAFKIEEVNSDVTRIGTHIPISKRILRQPAIVMDHLRRQLPAQVKYFEDWQLLWGDGTTANNLKGIFNEVDDFATVINATKIVGVTGDVTSIETYQAGNRTIVNFTNNLDNLFNGDTITFAGTTGTTYNNSYTAIVINPKRIEIEQAFTADVNVLANWTFTVNNKFKDAVEAGQKIDVLIVANSLINVQQYKNTGYVLNPQDATDLLLIKGNDEHYVKGTDPVVVRDERGILRISGIPVVETTAMPAGKFVCGDWDMAAGLFQFTNLTLEFAESVDQKLNNTVEAIIQEEIIFPIYNKFMFISGDFATAVPAIAV